MRVLDCTLRDGGYYTNWDFDPELVKCYFQSFNNLPVDYLEIGYRSNSMKTYLGEYFYCPQYVLAESKSKSNKKLAIILNEKDIRKEHVKNLLEPCLGLIDLVRIAIDPKEFTRALGLAAEVKKMGFEVGFNVMYMSTWNVNGLFNIDMHDVNDLADYFYMVDSFGGVFPEDVKNTIDLIRSKVNVKVGFHGHNNLELALINTLTAIDHGVDMVDATITGMGRGAGNLKTELLLSVLDAKNNLDLDFNSLSNIVSLFETLKREYRWGGNLPYIVSGANSLPQKEVMEWVTKRFYSFNSIIRALSNKSKGIKDNISLEVFHPENSSKSVLIVGGGESAKKYARGIKQYLDKNQDIILIHASSKNAKSYDNLTNKQLHCLAGNEGYRLENNLEILDTNDRIAILGPYPRQMGTYIPTVFKTKSFQLKEISFTNENKESITAIAIQTALDLNPDNIFFIGYDGYEGQISNQELELFNENESLFKKLNEFDINVTSLTPTKYKGLGLESIFSLIR